MTFPRLLGRRAQAAAAARERSRGITSSANSVRFFTVFQCGMSATCITQLMWFVFIRCDHSPIWLATLSGVPTAMKNDLLIAVEVEAAVHLVGHAPRAS